MQCARAALYSHLLPFRLYHIFPRYFINAKILRGKNVTRHKMSRRMRRAGHVARMGEEKGAYRVLVGKRGERDHWGDLGVDGWIILGWISRRWDVGMWTGLGWPRIGTGGGRL